MSECKFYKFGVQEVVNIYLLSRFLGIIENLLLCFVVFVGRSLLFECLGYYLNQKMMVM